MDLPGYPRILSSGVLMFTVYEEQVIKPLSIDTLQWLPTIPYKYNSAYEAPAFAMIGDVLWMVNTKNLTSVDAAGVITTTPHDLNLPTYPNIIQTASASDLVVKYTDYQTSTAGEYYCALQTSSRTFSCFKYPSAPITATQYSEIFVNGELQYLITNSYMVRQTPNKITTVEYRPGMRRTRSAASVAIGDQILYCSRDQSEPMYKGALVAMNIVTGETRMIHNFSCTSIVAYNGAVYAIVLGGVATINPQTLAYSKLNTDEQPVALFVIPKDGVYYQFESKSVYKISGEKVSCDRSPLSCTDWYPAIVYDSEFKYVQSDQGIIKYNAKNEKVAVFVQAWERCTKLFSAMFLDPREELKTAYLVCAGRVVQFELVNGRITAEYEDTRIGSSSVAFSTQGDLWIFGDRSNYMIVVSKDKLTSPFKQEFEQETNYVPEPIPTYYQPTSMATNAQAAGKLILGVLLFLIL
jgi:hypothetical protein